MVTVYFEDPKIHPRLMSSAVRHSLWRFTKRHNAAFRTYTAARLGQLAPGQLPGSNDEAGSSRSDNALSCSKMGACASAAPRRDGADRDDSCSASAQRQLLSPHGVLRGVSGEPSYAGMRTLLHSQRSGSDGRARPQRWRFVALCTALAVCARRVL